MGFATTGLRGGVSNAGHQSVRSSFWRSLAEEDSVFDATPSLAPKNLTVVVNNQCNLHCRHCYLQVERLSEPELSIGEWDRLIESVVLHGGMDLITLAGKEVFLGEKGSHILSRFSQALRQQPGSPRLGLITNGTLTHRALEVIKSSALDYFDISVDGAEAEHDAVRGSGAFAAMAKNLPPLRARFENNLFACLTLQQANLPHLDKALISLSDLGFGTVGIGYFQPQPYTDNSLALGGGDYERFFNGLESLGQLPLCRPLTLLMELDPTNFQALCAFLRSGWFVPSSVFRDARGDLVQEHVLANGLRLQFRLAFLPSYVSRAARITAEGLYLAGDDTLNTRLYSLYALNSARKAGLDFSRLHEDASNHPRLDAISRAYNKRELPALRAALFESGAVELQSANHPILTSL